MKRICTILSFAFFGIALSSCLPSTNKSEKADASEFAPITINNEYTVDIPTFMVKTTGLNEEASLQFQNVFKETYVIVIDESKDEFVKVYNDLGSYDSAQSTLQNYADVQRQSLAANMNVLKMGDLRTFKMNGLDAAEVLIEGELDGVPAPIAYFVTFIEGTDKLYMMMAWTLREKQQEHANVFKKIASSFKQVP